MGTTLTGKNISASYLGLLKTTDNAVIGGTAKIITDGNGNDSPLYLSTTRVGIGITPTSLLHVNGDANINTLTVGLGSGSISTNTVFGNNALKQNTTGYMNTAIGVDALRNNTDGDNNIAIGRLNLDANTSGIRNVALGNQSLTSNTTGSYNVGLGYDGLSALSSGGYNIGIGYEAGNNITTGTGSIMIGGVTRSSGVTSSNEIVIGYNTTGNGSNTVTIGNSSITTNYFSGDILLGNSENLFWGNTSDVYISGTTVSDNIQLGVGGSTQFTFSQASGLRLHQYGSGTITGTVTQRLGVDSSGNVIEIPIGGGAVDGSGTANTVTMWSDSDTITDAPITISGNNSTFAGNIRTSGNILFDEDRIIARNTSDGSDSGTISLTGGGDASSSRGAYLQVFGNEHSSLAGQVRLVAGNVANAELRINAVSATGFITNYVGGSEKMRLDSSGQLGLGTTSPQAILDVQYNNSTIYDATDDGGQRSGTATIHITNETSTEDTFGQIMYDSRGSGQGIARIVFLDSGSASVDTAFVNEHNNTKAERMRITSDGLVGIGTDSPSAKLHIKTTSTTNTNQFLLESTDAGASSAPDLALYRNSASPADDDVLGALWFYGNNDASTQELYSGIISVASDVSDGTEDSEIRFLNMVNGTLDTRMTIDGENVGIGTASPDGNLEVIASTVVSGASDTVNNVLIGLQSANRPTIILDTADTTYTNRTWNITNVGSLGSLAIGRNGLDVMTMKNDGNVGIGTSSPAYELVVNDETGSSVIQLRTGTTTSENNILFGDSDSNAQGRVQYNHTGDYLALWTAGSERARLDSSGNLGIGTSSPGAKLDIHTATNTNGILIKEDTDDSITHNFYIDGSDNGVAVLYADGQSAQIQLNTAGNSYFNGGNVGIGTSSPSSKLEIANGSEGQYLAVGGDTASNGRALTFTSSSSAGSNGALHTINASSVNGVIALATGSTERARITSDGRVFINNTTTTRDAFTMMEGDTSNYVLGLDAPSQYASAYRYVSFFSGSNIAGTIVGSNQTSVSYNTSSDYRLKEDLQDFNALEIASKIKMYDFKWKADDSRSYGVMAHELEEVLPQAVTGEKDGENMQQVDYSKLVPILLKGMQEQQAMIDELKAEIDELKKNK